MGLFGRQPLQGFRFWGGVVGHRHFPGIFFYGNDEGCAKYGVFRANFKRNFFDFPIHIGHSHMIHLQGFMVQDNVRGPCCILNLQGGGAPEFFFAEIHLQV